MKRSIESQVRSTLRIVHLHQVLSYRRLVGHPLSPSLIKLLSQAIGTCSGDLPSPFCVYTSSVSKVVSRLAKSLCVYSGLTRPRKRSGQECEAQVLCPVSVSVSCEPLDGRDGSRRQVSRLYCGYVKVFCCCVSNSNCCDLTKFSASVLGLTKSRIN